MTVIPFFLLNNNLNYSSQECRRGTQFVCRATNNYKGIIVMLLYVSCCSAVSSNPGWARLARGHGLHHQLDMPHPVQSRAARLYLLVPRGRGERTQSNYTQPLITLFYIQILYIRAPRVRIPRAMYLQYLVSKQIKGWNRNVKFTSTYCTVHLKKEKYNIHLYQIRNTVTCQVQLVWEIILLTC